MPRLSRLCTAALLISLLASPVGLTGRAEATGDQPPVTPETSPLLPLDLSADNRQCSLARSPQLTVDGQPIFGGFSSNAQLEDVQNMLALRVNLLFSYSPRDRASLLRMEDPRAQAIVAAGARVMYNLRVDLYFFTLSQAAVSTDTTLRITTRNALPKPGERFRLGNELIACDVIERAQLSSCRRGLKGTASAEHYAGVSALVESAVTADVRAVRDSPVLWGYWILDDNPGEVRGPVQRLAEVVRRNDCAPDGTAYSHPILCGIADMQAVGNFSAEACDAAGVYVYPNLTVLKPDKRLPWMRTQVRSIVRWLNVNAPGKSWIGIYAAFGRDPGYVLPTADELIRMATIYRNYGAAGLMAFIWEVRADSRYQTLSDNASLWPALLELQR